ncbi:MAG: protein kinase [Polyangiaceae bacterium]
MPRYTVEGEIAAGGMGVVYRVFDGLAGETRAMKRLAHEVATHRPAREAFELEYHVLSSLEHPRIIRVFDYGVDEQGAYYTMELLEGEDLREVAPLPYKTACLHLRDIATSLALLHARRFVHRDVSPNNVRMTPDGRCKLFDFGALTGFGYSTRVVGTPPVISPEAFSGASLDQRTDLYSLGALAYWMLTGQHAYPARHIPELPSLWSQSPRRPSSIVRDIPKELDALVLSLLHADPLARPGSAGEVIARLNVIADLPKEDSGETERLADAFLGNPRFTGRSAELEIFQKLLDGSKAGRGGSLCVQAVAGMGRSRLLDEMGVRAQLAGATVVRADAAICREPRGVIKALALRLLDVVPGSALKHRARFWPALATLGPEVEARFRAVVARDSTTTEKIPESESAGTIDQWFAAVSHGKPLVLAVDNVEFADPDSLALLIALARMTRLRSLVLVVTERVSSAGLTEMGLQMLESQATPIELVGFSAIDMLSFARSLFGDAPHVERFAVWLQERTAGSPLHSLAICRQLAREQVIRFQGGVWTLPMEKPNTQLPAAIGDAFSARLVALSPSARSLVECLSLHRERPTLDLCRQLVGPAEEDRLQGILQELAVTDVLYADSEGYHFSSSAQRDALLSGMTPDRLEQTHRRLGEVLSTRTAEDAPALRVEAGWHLIQGGEGGRGADMIAAIAQNPVKMRTLMANRFRAGAPLEAALKVYRRERRTAHERMPVLAALAQAGYYEGRSWGERYGDEALDLLEDMSGLRAARALRPYVGGFLSILLGLLVGFVRFRMAPAKERRYSFGAVLIQLFSVTTTMAAVASLTLDPDRALRVAETLEPFSVLPARLTPVGVYEFCRGLSLIAGEYEADAFDLFDKLIRRFEDPRYYPTLPADARKLYLAGAHFARGSCSMFRADGRATLESADALDAVGMQLYAMIACQLRLLYYTLRGELALAAPFQEQVELHAAHVGSAWQVETWAVLALALLHCGPLRDPDAGTRAVDRLELVTRAVPELRKYARFARESLLLASGDMTALEAFAEENARYAPRKHRGWAARQALLARAYNELGRFEDAKDVCEHAQKATNESDRAYVMLFLHIDRELALAEAGLGQTDRAMGRLDALIEHFASSDHPLVHGLLHEARAHIAWSAGDTENYERSLAEVERWYRPTGTPALIETCEQLASLPRRTEESVRMSTRDPETMPCIVVDSQAEHASERTQTESVPRASIPSTG